MNASIPDDGEAQLSSGGCRRGGWITFPFISATTIGLTLASWGWTSNLIVYLIEQFQVKSIDAAQISNLVNGCGSLVPVIGAIISDSFLGCFSVVWISSFISLLGTILMALTAVLNSPRPEACKNGSISCHAPSTTIFAVLYGGIALATIGYGGMRTTVATMGANQFFKTGDQETYFNWYFFTNYTSALLGSTVLVYVEDNVGWKWGFGICVALNVLGLAIFLLGNRYYLNVKPHGSPFTSMARVLVASIRKCKGLGLDLSGHEKFYYEHEVASPTKSFKFLNRASLITQGDTKPDGSIAKPWSLCSVQQVEDFKALIKILPLWSSSLFLATPIGIKNSLVVLQALTVDRHLGPNFKIPAGSILVFDFISTCLSLAVLDKIIWPMWQGTIGRSPTPLQRIGVGHGLSAISMAVSALVEIKRLKIAHSHQHHLIVPMSVLWLVPQLAIGGIGEAFHLPGQVALYYQEFPKSLKSLATAMISLIVAIAFFLSTAIIDLVRRATGWLPDNINDGRIDNVYWVLFVIGLFNFGYYLVCACLYEYKNVEKVGNDSSSSAK